MPIREDFQDPAESKQGRFQMRWDKQMANVGRTSPHKKVAVLLISWDEKLDDLKTGEEVCRHYAP